MLTAIACLGFAFITAFSASKSADDKRGFDLSTAVPVAYAKDMTDTNFAASVRSWLSQEIEASQKGDSNAEFRLGLFYYNYNGSGASLAGYPPLPEGFQLESDADVAKNIAESISWFHKAADHGHMAAQEKMGFLCNSGIGTPKNREQAIMWYRKAAEQGDAEGSYALANMYTMTEPKEAIKWYEQAVEQGMIEGLLSIAEMYRVGRGIPKNSVEAAKIYRKAADLGNCNGQFQLGTMYELGEGVAQDYIEAYEWYNLSAAHSDSDKPWEEYAAADAARKRDRLGKRMTPAQIAVAQRRSAAFVTRKGLASKSDVPGDLAGFPVKATGTGFLITSDGYMLTAAHVVAEAEAIRVVVVNTQQSAKIMRIDTANDVAILKVAGLFSPISIASSKQAKLGHAIFTIGFPLTQLQGVSPKLTRGDISSLNGFQDDPRVFQISSPIQPGNSGGPLVDENGNVIGLVAAKLSDAVTAELTGSLPQNVNYALKSAYILPLLDSIPDLAGKLKEPNRAGRLAQDEVTKQTEAATCLILIY